MEQNDALQIRKNIFKLLVTEQRKKMSNGREVGAGGASLGQAENGILRKEEEAVFNGMEIKR